MEPRAIVSLAEAGKPRSVGHLVAPALSVDVRLTGEEVNRLFDENPAVNSVTMSHPGKPESLGVITRLGFYRAMTGRFGYGYSLYTRRPVAALANWNPLVVDAGDDVETVTALVLRQPRQSRREDIVVRARDGSVGTVSAVDLFEAIAGLYGHDAVHDALTGLPNRFLLRERVQQALDALDGAAHPVGVILIDLDDFKFVNDTLGHAAGDALLLDFARRASALMRPEDTLARLGGDEFAILVPRMTQPSDASAIATRLVECLHQPFDTLGHQLRVGASMGIATATERGSADVLLRNADLAMYEAKREQPGGVRAFDPLMHARAVERLRLEHELKRAIVADELFLLYQPQVALDGGAIGVEALVRWRHPTLGELSPSRFIGLAEQSGLIFDVDAWVVRRACAEAREWSLPLPVSVNISPRTLDSGLLAQVVGDALLDSGLPAARLELEVTERVAAVGASKAPETLAELRQWGVRIALDDFGTGYSALSQLSAYPLDTVKIDRSFIAQLETRPAAETIVRAIIAMATALGLSVVAEGVETAEQLEFLRQNACHAAQGFLLARPVPQGDVERAVEDAVTRGRRLATRLRAI